jgi:hypothetical protein
MDPIEAIPVRVVPALGVGQGERLNWDGHRPLIEHYWIEENHILEDVVKIMAGKHNFHAK